MGLDDNDLLWLQTFLMQNPSAGDIIPGTGGARKLRRRFQSKGTSGGIRVIYVDLAHKAHIHLLICYPKTKQDDLTQVQKNQLKELIGNLKGA